MKRIRPVMLFLVVVCISFLLAPQFLSADVEWATKKKIDLKAKPLDSVLSADGQLLFILTPGEILIYSVAQGKIKERIPVGKGYDSLAFSPKDNTLIVTSSAQKTLEMIQLEFIQNIDISGLPVKGLKTAPVIIAVFSDYQ